MTRLIARLIGACATLVMATPALAATTTHECLLCTPVATIVGLGDTFSRKVFAELGNYAADLIVVIGEIWFMLVCLKLILNPQEGRDLWSKVLKQATLIILLTSAFNGGGSGWAFEWGFDLFQLQAVSIGNAVLDDAKQIGALSGSGSSISGSTITVGSTTWTSSSSSTGWSFNSTASTSSTIGSAYVTMWMQLEDTVYPLFDAFMTRMKAASGLDVIAHFIIWVVVIIPYIFVGVVFGAFLLQASFYFIVISSISPVLMLGIIFEKTRGFFFAGLRLCLSGSFTIVFAAIALGLTSTVISDGITSFNNTVKSNDKYYTEPYYLELILMGWVSVALHLIAPRLASNVSGAQDSATSAAAAVAFTQWATAKGLYGGYRLGRGAIDLAARPVADLFDRGRRAAGETLTERFRRARNDDD